MFNSSRLDVENEQTDGIKVETCMVSPGDMLYIPKLHWHYVRSDLIENSRFLIMLLQKIIVGINVNFDVVLNFPFSYYYCPEIKHESTRLFTLSVYQKNNIQSKVKEKREIEMGLQDGVKFIYLKKLRFLQKRQTIRMMKVGLGMTAVSGTAMWFMYQVREGINEIHVNRKMGEDSIVAAAILGRVCRTCS